MPASAPSTVAARPFGDEIIDQAQDRLEHRVRPVIGAGVSPVTEEQRAGTVGQRAFEGRTPTSTTATYESAPWAGIAFKVSHGRQASQLPGATGCAPGGW